MKSDYLNPWDRVPSLRWDHKLGIVIFLVFVVLALMSSYANAYTITFQSKNSTATVYMPAKCPGNPYLSISKSEWNRGAWPLFRITCYYRGKAKWT
jgi:hypothetical protein